MKDQNIITKFLSERPSINVSAFARECGISPRYMTMLINGERKPSEKVEGKIINKMNLYGHIPTTIIVIK